jgi:replicative DNA helicase
MMAMNKPDVVEEIKKQVEERVQYEERTFGSGEFQTPPPRSEPGAFFDKEIEREIIGNLLTENASFLEVFDLLNPADFYSPDMARCYRTFSELYEKGVAGKTVDIGILAKHADVKPGLLVECLDVGFMAANIEYRARRVKALSQKRELYRRLKGLEQQISELEPAVIANSLSEIASDIALSGDRKRTYSTTELIGLVEKTQSERANEPNHIRGIKTGLHYLDKVLRGLQPKSLTLVAAATGFGKTTLSLNLLSNIARAGHKVLFISNENDVGMNLDRLCGIAANRPLKEVSSGFNALNVTEEFSKAYRNSSMFLTDNAPRDINEVCGLMRKYSIQHGVEVVLLDYIGEISESGSGRGQMESEEQRLARWTAQLLQTARAQNIHLVLVAQLNRAGNVGGKPTKAELAGCFKMAQKAHSLLLFWQDTNGQDVLTVEKNRTGQAGVSIAVNYNRHTQKITDTGLYDAKKKEVVSKQPKSDGRAAAAGERVDEPEQPECSQEQCFPFEEDVPF